MAVKFILGRARSGKTQRCIREIVEACRADPLGPPIFFIVPKQATFGVQRRLAMASGLPGFCRVRVLSFDRWADQIVSECGGDAVPAVTRRGRRFILQHLLRELSPKLKVFSASARRVGLADELDATFDELENNGHDAFTLSSLIETLAAEDPDPSPAVSLLIDKLRDLHMLYGAYQDYLGQDRLDPHRRLRQCMELAARSPSLRAAEVFVDGHLDFSTFDCRLLATAGKVAASVTISMLMDPRAVPKIDQKLASDASLFHRTQRAYQRLLKVLRQEGVAVETPQTLERTPTAKPTVLDLIERDIFSGERTKPVSVDGSFVAMQLSEQRSEIHAAASVVRRWMREGRRARDIAVLTRTSAGWHELIQAIFTEHGIATFTDRRRTAAHHPLFRVVWAILQAATRAFAHEAMMTLAKSDIAGLSREDADELENYVLRHGISGAVWARAEPWAFSHRAAAAASVDLDEPPEDDGEETDPDEAPLEPDFVESLRLKLVGPVKRLGRILTSAEKLEVRELAAALLSTLYDYQVDDRLADMIEAAEKAGEFEQAEVHQQVWAEFVDLLDELVEVIGLEKLTAAEFVETIESALSQFDLAIAPPAVDQVLIGDVERTRFEHFPCVILLGMNQGEFPLVAAEPTVLGDTERRRLESRIELEANTERQLLDEPLLAYIGFTRATERLVVMRHLADEEGRPTNASAYWRELSRIVTPMPQGKEGPTLTRIAPTPSGVVADLAAWARGVTCSTEAPAIYQHLVTSKVASPARRLIEIAWLGLLYRNQATLSPEVVAELFGKELAMSVTQIEDFAACPFKHFAHRVLKLNIRPEPDVNAMDLGTLYHGVLEDLVAQLVAKKQKWNLKHQPTRQAIRQIADKVGEELRGQLVLAAPRNQYLLSRLEGQVEAVMAQQHAAGAMGALAPAAVELRFGTDSDEASLDPLVLHTPGKRVIRLHGKIDRVDVSGKLAAVFDYKLGQADLSLSDVYQGLALQLVTYLLVLQANGHQLAGEPLTPIAAFYVRLMQKIETIHHPSEALEPDAPEFHLVKRRGLFDVSQVDVIAAGELRQKVILSMVNTDGTVRRDKGDQLEPGVFVALLKHVKATICRLADELAGGDISVFPYRIGETSPCARCEYRAVCRFEPPINQYKHLAAADRKAVVEMLLEDYQ